MRSPFWRISLIVLVLGIAWPQWAGAALNFNRNLIITDEDMTGGTFSQDQTIALLRAKGGYLGQHANEFGPMIYRAAISHGINPQVLIVMIQKESSLVENPNPTPDEINKALGADCPDNGSCNPAFQGFEKQVSRGAELLQAYLFELATNGVTRSGWRIGVEKRAGAPRNKTNPNDSKWEYIDGKPVFVTPVNAATAALFTYNPWVGGHTQPNGGYIGANYNFRLIWDRYFVLRRIYPDGALLRAKGSSTIWLIKNGNRHPFLSQSAFLANYDPRKVISVPADELERYERGPGIKFADFSLLQAPNGGVYLLADGKKRPITSRLVFRAIGFNPEEVIKVTWDDLAPYPTGEKITAASQRPAGRLVQIAAGGIVYIDEQNVSHPIYSKEILRSQFARRRPEKISAAAFAQLSVGEPVKFKDGELVTAPGAPSVYLISQGQKRPIASRAAFAAYRFSWRNVIKTNLRSLDAHPTGESLTAATS